jgi:hypothetical protein
LRVSTKRINLCLLGDCQRRGGEASQILRMPAGLQRFPFVYVLGSCGGSGTRELCEKIRKREERETNKILQIHLRSEVVLPETNSKKKRGLLHLHPFFTLNFLHPDVARATS